MKRIVTASSDFNSQLKNYHVYTRGGQKFAIHENNPKEITDYKAQITEIHPYDEEDYIWARIGAKGAMQVEFIEKGKVVDKMQMHYYDPEDYESEDEYIDEIIDTICVELRRYNWYILK